MKHCPVKFVLWLVMAFSQTGCMSVLVTDSVLPAQVAVSDAQWKVAALNRFDPDTLTFKREQKTAVFAAGAQQAFAGALDAIDEDNTYLLGYIDTAAYATLGSGKQLTPAQVQEVYRLHPHHLLLTLDDFRTYLEQEVVREEDEDGNVNKTAYYTLFATSTWTLYDSTGAVLDHVSLSRDELYNSRGVISGLLAIGPSLANAGPNVNALAAQTGFDYWDRLSPHPITISRPYYSAKAFAPAAVHIAAGEWAAAIDLLTPLAASKKKKQAARAAYNLAVLYEAMGQQAEAERWITAAARHNGYARSLVAAFDY